MRFSLWLTFILLFSVSANTSKNIENLLEIDLSREIVCSSIGDKVKKVEVDKRRTQHLSLTIFPQKMGGPDEWFKSKVTIVKERALQHEFTMNCKVTDFNYFCFWDMYYHLALDLENIWVEKISSSRKVSHFQGVWQQGSFAQPEIIYCSQIK